MDADTLKLSDKFEIRLDSILSSYDRKILTRLYQPICGFGAISLFFTLWSEFEGDQTYSTNSSTHERLFDILQCNIYQFIEFRKKLEALGLLTTLIKSNLDANNYIYIIKAPCYPKDFFAHPLLNALLNKYLKESEYEKTRTFFLKAEKSISGYSDISATYKDIYKIDKDASIKVANNSVIGKEHAQIRLDFDFDTFYLGLKDYMLPLSLITDKIKQEIIGLSNVYQISAFDMRNVVSSSVKIKDNIKYIDIELLRKNAALYNKAFSSNNEKKPEVNNISSDGLLADKVSMFNELSPYEFLAFRNSGITPLAQDVAVIDELHQKTNLSDPVINVLLDFSLLVNNNSLPKTYIMKVAGSLMRSKITTAHETMIYFNNYTKKINISTFYSIDDKAKISKQQPVKKAVVEEKGEGYQAIMDLIKAGDDNGKD